VRNSADTVEKCQAACINNGSCTGVDWDGNTGVPDGQKCWLSGPWSGDKGQAQGVTHYTLSRNCAGENLWLVRLSNVSVVKVRLH